MVSLAGLLEMEPQAHHDAESFDLWPILARHGIPQPETADEAGELLDRAGDARFRRKAANLRRFIQEQGAEQTLYETLMEGLGVPPQPATLPETRLPGALCGAATGDAVQHPSGGFRQRCGNGRERLAVGSGGARPGSGTVPPLGLRRAMSSEEWRLFRVRPSTIR